MKTHRFRSLIWLVGCLGCAVLADENVDSPTREILDSYPYQPALVALPALPEVPPEIIYPDVSPSFASTEDDYRIYDALQPILAAQDQEKRDALFVWDLGWNAELKVLVKPGIHELVIPWSPMTTTTDVTFTPSSIDSSTSKLQARFPILSLTW